MTDISSMTFWGLPSFVILVSLYVSSVLFPLRFFLRSSPAWLSLLISPALLPDLQSAVPTYLNSVNPSPTSSVCHFPDLCFPASHPLISLVCILSPVICSVIVEPSVQFPLSCCWVPPRPQLVFVWLLVPRLFLDWILFAFVLGLWSFCYLPFFLLFLDFSFILLKLAFHSVACLPVSHAFESTFPALQWHIW